MSTPESVIIYHNNKLKAIETTIIDKSINGHYIRYHRNGLIELFTDVKNNKICGYFISLHNHAFVDTTVYLNNNVPYGNYRRYYRNGKTMIECFFTNEGNLDGKFKYYQPCGKTDFSCEFVNGQCTKIIVNEVKESSKYNCLTITSNDVFFSNLEIPFEMLKSFDTQIDNIFLNVDSVDSTAWQVKLTELIVGDVVNKINLNVD